MRPDLAYWGQLVALLALEGFAIVVLAAWVERRLTRPAHRRLTWATALLTLALLWAGELGGLRLLFITGSPTPAPRTEVVVSVVEIGDPFAQGLVAGPAPLRAEVEEPVWWPAWLWLAGSLTVLLRSMLGRLALHHQRRQALPADPETLALVERLARRLGVRRARVECWPRLPGPVAFGLVTPTIALPADLPACFPPLQREAMLAHELAHLASHDPWWREATTWIAALAWWHPGVAWARRRLETEMESAADAASSLIQGGPPALAEALVGVGRRLLTPPEHRALGMAGAGAPGALASRVQALLTPGAAWTGIQFRDSGIALACASGVLLAALGTSLPGAPRPSLAATLRAALRATPSTLSSDNSPNPPTIAPGRGPAPTDPGRVTPPPRPPRTSPIALAEPERVSSAADPGSQPAAAASATGKSVSETADRPNPLEQTNPEPAVRAVPAVQPPPQPPSLETRVWRVDAGRLRLRLASRPVPPHEDWTDPDPAPLVVRAAQATLADHLRALGVEISPPAACYLSERSGLFMYRGSEQDLDKVGRFLDSLEVAAAPRLDANRESVTLAIRILEVPEPDRPSSGRTRNRTGPALWESIFVGLPDERTPPRVASPAGDQPGSHSPHADNIRVESSGLTNQTVVLGADTLRELESQLVSGRGITQIAAPRITTTSGRAARIQVLETRSIVAGVETLDASPTNQAAINYHAEPMQLGPTVDLLPTVEAGSWRLQLTARHTEFLGYQDPVDEVVEARGIEPDLPAVRGQKPLPRFRVRETVGANRLRPGEALLLRGPVGERSVVREAGWFRKARTLVERRRLYYVVTLARDPRPAL